MILYLYNKCYSNIPVFKCNKPLYVYHVIIIGIWLFSMQKHNYSHKPDSEGVYCQVCGEGIDIAQALKFGGAWICAEHYIDDPVLAHGIGFFFEGADHCRD